MQSPIHISFSNHLFVAPSVVKAAEKPRAAVIFDVFSMQKITASPPHFEVTKALATSLAKLRPLDS